LLNQSTNLYIGLWGGPKSDTHFNYVNTLPYQLQYGTHLYCLNYFNISYNLSTV